jgi:hypothetical protein
MQIGPWVGGALPQIFQHNMQFSSVSNVCYVETAMAGLSLGHKFSSTIHIVHP